MDEAPAPLLVHVVDDDPGVRRSLCLLLSAHGYATAPADSAEAFLERFEPGAPACLLLDIRMPGMSGMDLQLRLRERAPDLPVVMLTGHGDVPLAVRAMKNGAADFLEKPVREQALLAALGDVGARLSARRAAPLADPAVAERLARLTTREREVLDELLLGKTSKEIAGTLGISRRTVEIHRARVREKMEARSLADLMGMMR